jgi:enamine deaminase RidA (YjgF/YER057c/UK114 family)
MAVSIETRIRGLGLVIPEPAGSKALYRPTTRIGPIVVVSGQGPFGAVSGEEYVGVIGEDLTLEQGQEAARQAALNLLAAVRAELGTLDSLVQVLKLTVFVRCVAGFGQEHLVADGATRLLAEVLGEGAVPARSAVGVFDLPFGICVEVDGMVEVAQGAADYASRGTVSTKTA